jgi:cytochrome P450
MKFETLRLYGGISEIPKTTAASTTHLSIRDQTYTIPPETIIWCNSAAVHTQSRYWGPDSLVWRPTRWISPPTPSPPKPSTPAVFIAETIQEPTKGYFVPWSAGARVCPGHKFVKVEFVAVMAALFRTARVSPALLKGESVEAARERILKTVEDLRVVVTLQMMKPEGVGVVWTRK